MAAPKGLKEKFVAELIDHQGYFPVPIKSETFFAYRTSSGKPYSDSEYKTLLENVLIPVQRDHVKMLAHEFRMERLKKWLKRLFLGSNVVLSISFFVMVCSLVAKNERLTLMASISTASFLGVCLLIFFIAETIERKQKNLDGRFAKQP